VLNSHSVRTTEQGGVRGYDGAKKLCGRKRHLLVDTLGLVLLVMVTAADVQDCDGARTLLSVLATQFRRLRVIWADGAYSGALPHRVVDKKRRYRPLMAFDASINSDYGRKSHLPFPYREGRQSTSRAFFVHVGCPGRPPTTRWRVARSAAT
jgi:hypothetical protein